MSMLIIKIYFMMEFSRFYNGEINKIRVDLSELEF